MGISHRPAAITGDRAVILVDIFSQTFVPLPQLEVELGLAKKSNTPRESPARSPPITQSSWQSNSVNQNAASLSPFSSKSSPNNGSRALLFFRLQPFVRPSQSSSRPHPRPKVRLGFRPSADELRLGPLRPRDPPQSTYRAPSSSGLGEFAC